MKRILFILSLILMIGTQAKSIEPPLYEGACLDIIQQDLSQDFVYSCNFDNCKIIALGTTYPFLDCTIMDGYVRNMEIYQESLDRYCSREGKNEYFDILVKVQPNNDKYTVYNCYIRIQFIKNISF